MRPSRPQTLPTTRYEVDLPTGGEVGYGSRIAISPDGSKLVYQGPGPNGRGLQLWLRTRDRIEAVPIPGTQGAVHPFFSPDGTRLAFATNDPALKVMRLDGGLPVELTKSVGLAGASWSRDGYIYTDGLGSSLRRVPETGGTATEIAVADSAGGEDEIDMPYALPSGKGVIITIHRSQGAEGWVVGVLDTRTGKHRSLVPGIAGYYVGGRLLVVSAQGELSAFPFDQSKLTITGEPQVVARGVNKVQPWGVDLAVGDDALVYALGSAVKDTLQPGWVGVDGKFEPLAERWVGAIFDATLSPDATRIAFSLTNGAQGEIWVRRLDNGALTRLSAGNANAVVPTWSRDSKTVYYTQLRDRAVELLSRPADGSTGGTQIAATDLFLGGVTTSLDGSKLVFSSFDNITYSNLMMRGQGDSLPQVLLATPVSEGYPSISPDGRWLLFTSNEGGTQHIYVRPFPNVKETVWQVSTEPGDMPHWSNDGREIYYAGQDSLRAVEVVPGTTFALGRRRTLFSLTPFERDRRTWGERKDGRFLVLKRLSSPPNLKMVVVQNLLAELRTPGAR